MSIFRLPAVLLYVVLLASSALARSTGSVAEQFGLNPSRGDVSSKSYPCLVYYKAEQRCSTSVLCSFSSFWLVAGGDDGDTVDCFMACHMDVTSALPAPWMDDGHNFYRHITKNCQYQVRSFLSTSLTVETCREGMKVDLLSATCFT